MKATGMVRRIDDLGRIVIPAEIRKVLKISPKVPIEMYVENDTIVLKKFEPHCTFCGNSTNITKFKGKNVCESCKKALNK